MGQKPGYVPMQILNLLGTGCNLFLKFHIFMYKNYEEKQ